ncbi:arginine--tRNA ligase [Candidatus Woesearchaeota archaeon]|nr:arginine--tRNA ligase [Candidatus Woesearchaeota archaeon]
MPRNDKDKNRKTGSNGCSCYKYDLFRDAVSVVLSKELKDDFDGSLIEVPPDHTFGDYAYPCFSLAKVFKKSPEQISEEIAVRLEKSLVGNKVIARAQNRGPYLNFFVEPSYLSKTIISAAIKKSRPELQKPGKKPEQKQIIEFSSPNTNKPLHLGHLRNICLGESVSRLSESIGNNVIRTCLVNDRGTHICKSMLMYKKEGKGMEPDKKPDHFVGDFYVKYNELEKKDKGIEPEAQEMLRLWEAGDRETLTLWKKMKRWAVEGFNETYDELGIRFDKFYYESEIYKKGKDIVKTGLRKGVFKEEKGAIVADLSKEKLPNKVLVRSDGTSIYMTQDIYLAKLKFKDYGADSSVYVVGSEQNLHFQQLFAILKLLGFSYAERCYHLSYGMVYLPSGKMKSREGVVVDADDIISQMKDIALKEIRKRYRIRKAEAERRAAKIGLSALKFYLLMTDPGKDMTFNPEESISFEGETGPYVQYTYARASSILRKYNKKIDKNIDYTTYGDDELVLIKKMGAYHNTLVDAACSYKPSIVCRYLLDLCQIFNEYYHKTPVLKAEEAQMKARLLIVMGVRNILASGLKKLGIDVLPVM